MAGLLCLNGVNELSTATRPQAVGGRTHTQSDFTYPPKSPFHAAQRHAAALQTLAKFAATQGEKKACNGDAQRMENTAMNPEHQPPWVAAQLLAALQGDWRFSRSLQDLATLAPMGSVQGHASFQPLGADGSHYVENGQLLLPNGASFRASGRYFFCQQGADLCIYFDAQHQRLFHQLRPAIDQDGQLSASSSHLCIADRYDSSYAFLRSGGFVIEHQVRGPHKSYRSYTLYERPRTHGAHPSIKT